MHFNNRNYNSLCRGILKVDFILSNDIVQVKLRNSKTIGILKGLRIGAYWKELIIIFRPYIDTNYFKI